MDILNDREYIENFLYIRDKKGQLLKLKLNPAQLKLDAALEKQRAQGKPERAIVLKARQLGFSTYTEAKIFKRSATAFNSDGLILAHRDDSTAALFRMTKLFYECLPPQLRPMSKKSNDTELLFENPTRSQKEKDKNPGLRSSIICNTAGTGGGVGRGTTKRSVHCSEYAFWRGEKDQTLLGILQAVPAEAGTLIIIESTANGFEEFQKLWDAAVKGESDFAPVFCGWYEDESYRREVPPDTVWTEKELQLKAEFNLDDEQLAWRRWCIKNNCGGDERKFRQEYPATPDEAFLTSGTGVFDNEIVMARRKNAPCANATGCFKYDYDGLNIGNIEWVDNADGNIKLYSRPEKGVPYVLAGDTAGEGSDFFTGQVLDNRTGEQVAVLKIQSGEIEYTRQMYCLGRYFNWALMGIECNFTTYPQRELERLNYPNFYERERLDVNTNIITKSYGFRTDSKTRPVMVTDLKQVFEEHPELINDFDTLGEMLTFIRAENGRAQASPGEHDDLVMALAVAHQIRGQQRYTAAEEVPPPPKKLIDELRKNKRRSR